MRNILTRITTASAAHPTTPPRHGRESGHPRFSPQRATGMKASALALSVYTFVTLASPGHAATIPFVGCPTDADCGQVTPTGQPITVNIPDQVAAKLALYAGVENLGVLGPRGWQCSGQQVGGGNNMWIFPKRGSVDSATVIAITSDVDNSGGTEGVDQYARYFPKIISHQFANADAAGWNQSPDQYIIKKYSTDHLNYLTDSAFEFITPANHLGLGDVVLPVREHTPEPTALTTYGLISISSEDGTELQSLIVKSPKNFDNLHTYIIDFSASCFLNKSGCVLNANNVGRPQHSLGNVEVNLGNRRAQ